VSWINLVERRVAALAETPLRRGLRRSTRELELAIRRYADLTNAHPEAVDQNEDLDFVSEPLTWDTRQ